MPTYFIADPDFDEYVFHVMRRASWEEKSNLNPEELRHFNSERAIRRFAENETMDKRLLMLSRLGYTYCVVVLPKKGDLDGVAAKVTSQYRSSKSRLEIVQAMNNEKIFVVSSRDTMILSHMMAQNTHSQVYTLDFTYVKLRERNRELGRRNLNEEMRDAVGAFDDMAKITLATITSEHLMPSITGCTQFELSILLALYQHRNTMVTHDKVAQMLGETMRSTGVAKACGELEKRNLVFREPGYNRGNGKVRSQAYMVSDLGINAVLCYLKYIVKQSL